MEGVVRVSSANMNDRRNRWETGNGRGGEGRVGGEGRAEKTSTCSGRGPHENDRKRTNPPTLSLSRFLVGPCRQLVGRQQLYPPHSPPPLLGGKVGQIGKVRFPRRTTLSCTHARRFVTSFLPSRPYFVFLRETIFPAFFGYLH